MKPIALLSACLPVLASVAAAQWGTPTSVANVNSSASEFDPAPTFDGLSLYFCSTRNGGYDIFRATRSAPYGFFGTAVPVAELNTTGLETDPFVRFDELEIFFVTDRPGGLGASDIWRTVRSSTAVPFNLPVAVHELNSTGSDSAPSLTADGLRIYFHSSRAGGMGSFDIYTATRPNWSSPFGAPVPVTELNTTGDDMECQISADGLAIFFSSNRPGGLGGRDIWLASRLDPAAPFGTIVNVTALNSPTQDESPGFAQFHDEIFFTSSRSGGPGSFDIHSARFTGLVGNGIAGTASSQSLRFSVPASGGFPWVAAASRGSSPGIAIDTRVLPLNFDAIFQLTLGGLPPFMTGYLGTLDGNGIGSGGITFAGFPELRGIRLFTAFLVLDPLSPSGIRTISNAHEVLIQ